MDYFDQYTFARTSAQMIAEIGYTEIMTITSTAISAPVVALGSYAVSIVQEASATATNAVVGATSGAAQHVGQQATKFALKSLIFEIGKRVVIGTIKETIEEIVIDGFFETAIQSAVRMSGGSDAAGHWISTLFTSVRETANFGYLTGSRGSDAQGFAGQVQRAMELSTKFESIVSQMKAKNEKMSVAQIAAANEQFLTAQMAEIGIIGETLMESKITLGRILATGIFTGLSLLAPSLAGFNLYAISKLVGGIGTRIDAKIQNKFLAARNSMMLLKDAIEIEKQKAEMGKKPIVTQPETNLPDNTPIVLYLPEGANPLLERTPVEFATTGVSYFSAFGYKNGRPITHRQIIQEAINEEKARIAQNQEKLEDLKNSKEENSKDILEQQKEAKQKIFENLDLSGFDPYDSNLKYPLTDRDNLESILFKTLLNLIYKNKKTLESVYKKDARFEFTDDGTINYKIGAKKDQISAKNLGAILGIDDSTLRNIWLPKIDSQNQDFTFAKQHQISIRKIKDSLNSIFDHIRLKETQVIISSLIENYIELRYTGSEYFLTKLLTYIDDYTDFGVLSEYDISEYKFKMASDYLRKFRYENVYFEQLSKYFKLITNIYISGQFDFGITDLSKFNDFKQKVTDLAYSTLTDSETIKKTQTSKMAFESICLTLTALTNLRYHIPSIFPRMKLNQKNPKNYYTLADLSEKISAKGYRRLLSDQLRDGAPSLQLYKIISKLNIGIRRSMDGCSYAKYRLNKYLDSKKLSTSEIGNIMHPLYEQIVIAYLRSKGVRVSHESLVHYPRGFKPDNIIERSDTFREKIEALQDIVSIPDLIKLITVDYTFASDFQSIAEKFEKHYQSEDRLLVIVLLGQKNDRDIANINKKLQRAVKEDDGSNHLKNVRIITSEEYKEFLGFDGNFEGIYNRYQDYAFNIFHSQSLLYEAAYLQEYAEHYLKGLKEDGEEDWIKLYLRQR